MSHGPSVENSKADPNLTPLLDLVLQLLMFFMMCVNFVTRQVSKDIVLPVAQSARPMDKSFTEVLFLNMDEKGQLIRLGQPKPLTTPGEIRYYLSQEYADAKRTAEAKGDKSGKVKTVVIIRAHQNVNYAQIYNLLRTCKEVGYNKLQLRATIKAKART
jgi:biopolymer transport protein ExbD